MSIVLAIGILSQLLTGGMVSASGLINARGGVMIERVQTIEDQGYTEYLYLDKGKLMVERWIPDPEKPDKMRGVRAVYDIKKMLAYLPDGSVLIDDGKGLLDLAYVGEYGLLSALGGRITKSEESDGIILDNRLVRIKVDRSRGLPIEYSTPHNRVLFKDYRNVVRLGWIPYRVEFYTNGKLQRTIEVKKVEEKNLSQVDFSVPKPSKVEALN